MMGRMCHVPIINDNDNGRCEDGDWDKGVVVSRRRVVQQV